MEMPWIGCIVPRELLAGARTPTTCVYCRFLGQYDSWDLYFCNPPVVATGRDALVARNVNSDNETYRMLAGGLQNLSPELESAKEMAEAQGHLPSSLRVVREDGDACERLKGVM